MLGYVLKGCFVNEMGMGVVVSFRFARHTFRVLRTVKRQGTARTYSEAHFWISVRIGDGRLD